MTVRRQILNLLNGAGFPRTDAQIAYAIGRPEPSVRRTRIEMERDNLVVQANGMNPYEWTLSRNGRALAATR